MASRVSKAMNMVLNISILKNVHVA